MSETGTESVYSSSYRGIVSKETVCCVGGKVKH